MIDFVNNLLNKIFGNKSDKDIDLIRPLVAEMNDHFSNVTLLTDDGLREKTSSFKKAIEDGTAEITAEIKKLKDEANADNIGPFKKEEIYEQVDELDKKLYDQVESILADIHTEAFAVVKETSRRLSENGKLVVTATEMDKELSANKVNITIEGDKAIWSNKWLAAGGEIEWNMTHYDVQLIGGTVLHQGKIAEMATGEGKTLVATLPVYLNALSGRGVHLVTVNDYLARRDSEWIGPIFEFHGLTVDCIDKHKPHSEERRQAYLSDVTYGTNNEFGFDYLRDNMSGNPDDLVQRKHNYAIVDEVDSVLIDDARTPLIISGPTPKGDQQLFSELKSKVEQLIDTQRKYVNNCLIEAKKKLALTESEVSSKKELSKMHEEGGLALLRAHRGMPRNNALVKYMSEPGVKQQLMKTENFHLADNSKEMPNADAELYFVFEEKQNSVDLAEKGIDLITGNSEDKEFFILPDVAVETNRIESSEIDEKDKLAQKEELIRNYSIKAERIHTINQLLKAYSMFEKDVDYVVMENKVKIVDEQTGRIMEGRRYSDGLHQAIEAKEKVKIEAATQTYATVTLQNYFRMYDKLSGMTGTAETEAGEFHSIYELDVVVIPTNRPIVRNDENDLVFKTKREKYNAVVEEIALLRDSKRPSLVGTTSVEVSELLSRMLKRKNIPHQVLNAKLHQSEAEVVAAAGKPGTVTIATNMAGRGTDIKLAKEVKEAGGLAIVGTERHDSRRVDRQLRGRSGRQGDPGSTKFFVSLEDDLMRLFQSERISKLMDRMGLGDGEVIQSGMITKSIERAQRKVEENNFGVRKRLLEYDDVMNSQREVIYKKRRHALFGDRLSLDIANSFYEVAESIVTEYQDLRDFDGFKIELLTVLSVESPVNADEFINLTGDEITEKVFEVSSIHYRNKSEFVAKIAMPVLTDVWDNPENSFKKIQVPFTDGRKSLQIVADLEKSVNSEGKELIKSLEKSVSLAMIDMEWKEHLREMDDLRQSVQSAVYEQKDPLLIYKFESFELFKQMLDKVNRNIVSFLIKAILPNTNKSAIRNAEFEKSRGETRTNESRAELPTHSGKDAHDPGKRPEKKEPIIVEKKIGRNDKVKIAHITTGETQDLKFKQAEALIGKGQWQLVE
tara:strand:- start:9705 stop:13091 length:3387 start_codon:yes stop_codon:yes gene_type:complete